MTNSSSNPPGRNVRVTLLLGGQRREFRMDPSRGLDVLSAAIEAGHTPPHSCRSAICATCRARLLEGEIRMRKDHALLEEEIEAGFVLVCQSLPLSERVVLDYEYETL
ncbi:MAG: 2Fe-2S iron-sulfur cluster binding domain-containing protein [Gammaproteobacteria bacterium]|nr:2Fe-2S iron-sulfur cluster binding domain-containing protein [Gammaproteobacteria bacterium]